MAPDKDWIKLVDERIENKDYELGVQEFLNYAFSKNEGKLNIRCPCVKCLNTDSGNRDMVRAHLMIYGIVKNYTFWYHHGEKPNEIRIDNEDNNDIEDEESDDEIETLIRDINPEFCWNDHDSTDASSSYFMAHEQEPNTEAMKFYNLLSDCKKPIFNGSKCSKLSALVKLLHIKTIGHWSNESFTMLLQFLRDELLPEGSTLPDSYYKAKKVIKDLGLSYEKIDACVNSCMLFWKDDKDANFCKVCGASRWKADHHSGEIKCKHNGKLMPLKTLRYFPLKPRLQRLYMSTKTASAMRWHSYNQSKDGVMRHPVDSMAWRSFCELHKEFASDPRNVLLGLASDGFQPFTNAKTPYSIWPVILIPYNVPPWMCTKQSNLILSMLIPGPDSPGDAIDVYLQPLTDDLKDMWEVGVETFDASLRQNFRLHAALLWTINDFPAYGNLSGWSTKGKLACPCCHKETFSLRLTNCSKQCYMGHRRFLPIDHKWRNNKDAFDVTKEKRLPPKPLTGDEVLDQVHDIDGILLTKCADKKTVLNHEKKGDNWNKKSIFFNLPYWRTILLRHNLDLMHIEKNVCDNLLGTIMDIKGKTKDSLKARLDLKAMNIRHDLHPIEEGNKYKLPSASYSLSRKQKEKLCQFLKDLRVPDGFSSNISQCVNVKENKISSLKSHDCHVLLEHLLPFAIRGLLPKVVYEPLVELCMFFKVLGAKTLRLEELKQLEALIPMTLCKLEKVFLPSNFDVMLHLPIHLASEAIIAGPVQYRSMYFVEREMYSLKSYIRNRARPEGSIAEGYIADECMTFCSRYLHHIETKFNRPNRNDDNSGDIDMGALSIFVQHGRTLGASSMHNLEPHIMEQAHIYVLKNCPEVEPFIEEFSTIEGTQEMVDEQWTKSFIRWFQNKVVDLHNSNRNNKVEDLLSLSRGPTPYVLSYHGYIVNGYRFHARDYDNGLRTQNSGVVVVGDTGDGSSQPTHYYGILTDVIELQYIGGRRIVLFQCDWWNVYDSKHGIKEDEYGFTSVNFHRHLKTNESFVLAWQATQVFYVQDNSNKGWYFVLNTRPRDSYQMANDEEHEDNLLDHSKEAN